MRSLPNGVTLAGVDLRIEIDLDAIVAVPAEAAHGSFDRALWRIR